MPTSQQSQHQVFKQDKLFVLSRHHTHIIKWHSYFKNGYSMIDYVRKVISISNLKPGENRKEFFFCPVYLGLEKHFRKILGGKQANLSNKTIFNVLVNLFTKVFFAFLPFSYDLSHIQLKSVAYLLQPVFRKFG